MNATVIAHDRLERRRSLADWEQRNTVMYMCYLYVLQKIIDNCLISCSLHPIRRTSDRLSGHSIKFRDSGPAPQPSTCLPLIHSQSGQSTCLGAHPVSLINSNKMPPQISSSPRAHVRTIIASFPVQ